MVREQLKNQKKYKPYFIYTISILQVIVFIASLVMNYTSNGRIFEPLNENISIGPSTGTLIKIGARYVPCMKKIKFNNECPPGVTGSLPFQQIPGYQLSDKGGTLLKSPFYCTMKDICGFGGLFANDKSAKQWFRFVTAIFSHSGIAHIAINLIFQVRAGMSLEKDYGHWRIMVIYFLSGIFGYMLEAQSSAGVAVVGCSGSLYGLIACILLDLIQNWKLIVSPWKDLAVLVFSIVFSLGFGLLPFIDNFAHIGGFIMGILSGLIFLPSIIFNNKDEKIKSTLRIVSIFLATFIFVIVIKRFYSSSAQCKWCKYLNCAPFLSTTCNFQ
ncbi:rhomboid-domain-containing protein [Anaeromyces robustus]|uniref:Rhomboid-type serine protease n=1 Tax=Anaeromyces robustus TaxID=1754192 RepID=A0A1Y1WBW3_9FUNG|nr:rhomboid-domain-containing protein [Anaeromyces robustus]|eukprot:ORX71040.1 rhomboid-domain-containing protein [Anaeromyces robustus]